jgi:hypothetical protein
MSDPPRERRRTKPARPVEPQEEADAADAEDDAVDSEPKARPRAKATGGGDGGGFMAAAQRGAVWPLATGLAIGFAVGREAYRFSLDSPKGSDAPASSAAAAIAPEKVKAYATQAEFPAGWIKDADLGASGSVLAGLTDAQKTTVMQALNSRDCECGCGMGSLAICLKKDPNCPRSPAMAKLAVEQVKQGKGITEILAAIDAKQKEMGSKPAPAPAAGPEVPTTPKKVALNSWDPRKGPKAAKVTIVEFSDFQ